MTSSSILSSGGRGLEAEDLPRLADVRDPQLDVVLERRVADVAERPLVGRGSCARSASASSSTVVDSAVERLKSSLTAAGAPSRGGCRARGRRRRCSGGPGLPSPRMWSGSWPLRTFCTRSGTTWLMASLTLPDRTSVSPSARRSPIPTQLNGRTIVYGSLYCSHAPWRSTRTRASGSRRSRCGGGDGAPRLRASGTPSMIRRPSMSS